MIEDTNDLYKKEQKPIYKYKYSNSWVLNLILSIINFFPKHYWALTTVLIFAGGLSIHIGTSDAIKNEGWKHFWEILGTVFILEAVAALFHHYLIHKKNVESFVAEIDKKFKIIEHLNKIGLVNIESNLDLKKIIEGLHSHRGELILQRMYFSEEEYGFLKGDNNNIIIELIEKHKCAVKILLLSTYEENTIRKRIKIFDEYIDNPSKIESAVKNIIGELEKQLVFFKEIQETLMRKGLGEYFKIKIHDDFVSIPLTKYKDKIVFGNYLNHKLAENGVQFTAIEGAGTPLFNELLDHFKKQWINAFDYNITPDNKVIPLKSNLSVTVGRGKQLNQIAITIIIKNTDKNTFFSSDEKIFQQLFARDIDSIIFDSKDTGTISVLNKLSEFHVLNTIFKKYDHIYKFQEIHPRKIVISR